MEGQTETTTLPTNPPALLKKQTPKFQRPQNFFEAIKKPMALEAQTLADFREAIVREKIKRANGEIPDYISQRQQITEYRTNPYSSRHREKKLARIRAQTSGSNLSLKAFAQSVTEEFSNPEEGLSPPDQDKLGLNQEATEEQFRTNQQKALLQQKKNDQKNVPNPADQAKQQVQEEIRKQIKNGIRRGAEELAQSVGNAIDLGTGGISTLVTVFVYAFTLVDLNTQMIWGHYITKKRSVIFPALDWTPIPMPKIVPVHILHAGLVMVDFFLFFLVAVVLVFTLIIFLWPYIMLAAGLTTLIDFLSPIIGSYF